MYVQLLDSFLFFSFVKYYVFTGLLDIKFFQDSRLL